MGYVEKPLDPKWIFPTKTILETSKWVSFYVHEKGKVEQIEKALKDGKCPVLNMAFRDMFQINVSDRMGTMCLT